MSNKKLGDKRICRMCQAVIKDIKKFRSGTVGGKWHAHQMQVLYSENGVYFEGSWFCNECWEQIIKPIKEKLNGYS